jgi:hypothetical protein
MRTMMFKSFTHEIKTPLNGVFQSLDLTQTLLLDLVMNPRPEKLSKKLETVLKFMNQIFSGVHILQNNLNDLIVSNFSFNHCPSL